MTHNQITALRCLYEDMEDKANIDPTIGRQLCDLGFAQEKQPGKFIISAEGERRVESAPLGL